MQRTCSIVIIDLNCKEIHLKVSQKVLIINIDIDVAFFVQTVLYEMVFELREFLAEHVYTCFFTNFYFEHAGQRLNEYSELSELDLATNPRIIMKPGKLLSLSLPPYVRVCCTHLPTIREVRRAHCQEPHQAPG